jgi:TonB family protein
MALNRPCYPLCLWIILGLSLLYPLGMPSAQSPSSSSSTDPSLDVAHSDPPTAQGKTTAIDKNQTSASSTAVTDTYDLGEPTLTPPSPLGILQVDYPKDAPPIETSITIKVLLSIDKLGQVSKVELSAPSVAPQFEEAVLSGAKKFRFKPARWDDEAITVKVPFEQTFEPPPPIIEDQKGQRHNAILQGILKEKGTRALISGATVIVRQAELVFSGQSDQNGRFKVPCQHGAVVVEVFSSLHQAFRHKEYLTKGDELTVGYLIQRKRYDPDSIVVLGKRQRTEVSRITLKGKEIKQIPGTFGDPFRVVQTLPGVTTPVSILPIPIVRGSSPSSTGFLLDKVRIPLLFHLLGGPSVIHPEFIEEIHFYPGGFPPHYGGYTGGIIDGETRSARTDERLIDLDLNLLQSGLMVRTPIPNSDLKFTGAGRVGYPGLLISLASDDFSLEYWDYQARLDRGTPRNGWTVSSFGARDEIQSRPAQGEPLETSLRYEFHRVDLKHRYGLGQLSIKSQTAFGQDNTSFGSDDSSIALWHISPRSDAEYRFNQQWVGLLGIDGAFRSTKFEQANSTDANMMSSSDSSNMEEDVDDEAEEGEADFTLSEPGDITQVAVYSAAHWIPTPDWLIYPGLRLNWQSDQTATQVNFDPRLTVRYRLNKGKTDPSSNQQVTDPLNNDELNGEIWLKGGIGRYHQPPRFLLPIPGLDQLALEYGLLSAIQSTLGTEIRFAQGFSLDVQGYYNDMDPVIFDLSVNASSVNTLPTLAPGEAPDSNALIEEFEDRLFAPQRGRAYGLEFLLRRQSQQGIYGWLSYTLSRSERYRDGEWVLFDFDRPHILNVVLGVPLKNQWDIGLRFQYQSGTPATTTYGFNQGRKAPYMRLDFRIDKRAVKKSWLLDYYIDVQNVLITPEEVAPGQFFRYVLPTIGFRAKL